MQKKKKIGITMILVLFITIGIFCALPKQKEQLLQNTQIAMYYTDNGNYAGFSSAPSNHKYYEEYTTTTASTACGGSVCYGHGLSETAGWYGDYQSMVSATYPWFMHGAHYNHSSNVAGGLFRFGEDFGGSGNYYGVRAVLV